MSDWSNERSLELIELYKHRECLWKPSHNDYKNRIVRNDAWISISGILNTEVTDIKKKMESLLTSFRRERQKCETSLRTGSSHDNDAYKSDWFAFKSMMFLLDKFSVRRIINTEAAVSTATRQNKTVPEKSILKWKKNPSDEMFKMLIEKAMTAFETPEDEFEFTGKTIAAKFRKMDYNQFLHADKLINEVLYKGLQNQLSSNTAITNDQDQLS